MRRYVRALGLILIVLPFLIMSSCAKTYLHTWDSIEAGPASTGRITYQAVRAFELEDGPPALLLKVEVEAQSQESTTRPYYRVTYQQTVHKSWAGSVSRTPPWEIHREYLADEVRSKKPTATGIVGADLEVRFEGLGVATFSVDGRNFYPAVVAKTNRSGTAEVFVRSANEDYAIDCLRRKVDVPNSQVGGDCRDILISTPTLPSLPDKYFAQSRYEKRQQMDRPQRSKSPYGDIDQRLRDEQYARDMDRYRAVMDDREDDERGVQAVERSIQVRRDSLERWNSFVVCLTQSDLAREKEARRLRERAESEAKRQLELQRIGRRKEELSSIAATLNDRVKQFTVKVVDSESKAALSGADVQLTCEVDCRDAILERRMTPEERRSVQDMVRNFPCAGEEVMQTSPSDGVATFWVLVPGEYKLSVVHPSCFHVEGKIRLEEQDLDREVEMEEKGSKLRIRLWGLSRGGIH